MLTSPIHALPGNARDSAHTGTGASAPARKKPRRPNIRSGPTTPQMMEALKKTSSPGHVHGLPSGSFAGSQMLLTLSSSHHDVPKYTDDASTVPTSCMIKPGEFAHILLRRIDVRPVTMGAHLDDEHGARWDLHVVAQLEILQEHDSLGHADVAKPTID
uniref:Uncharacterized protein n=1 Tax=Oryza meridionalis TaxID=40149 RepID=A0A0E0EMN2_9ORYZ